MEEEKREQCLHRPEVAAFLVHPEGAGSVLVLQPTGGTATASFTLPIWRLLFRECAVPNIIYLFLQDEKAEGFVNISSYNIESAGEHKRK